ncbi:histidinol phosphate aminotransferase apoenzyme [Alkalithermobacter thermoalcaliphilus JW-YL-7 = DSM 7308]|uniref:Histidinol-phosphate aminotransferase n=1 Tax=Alkalithermobacter thermoalcaliphilus JW-YL-7 = DSM 7308 TaxID=1121328 RepID=A0A150FPH8_CLOPD|nr:Histidinol-phosphate aminotransferase [[Clostridium] paradoxum JW-YL-7 = DSM 7308]SHL26756.1 histidinol phosphate aminotransferase apoenzyme [[Clostridium] paradoxum JW-YL-7 = DSM 7308]
MNFLFRKELNDLVPYKPGKPIEYVMKEFGLTNVIKLASNENPLGCSEKVKQALTKALDNLHIYPDGNSTDLRQALGRKFNIDVSKVITSSGSDEMVDILAKVFINHGDEVIMADLTFPRYITTTKMMGGVPVIVPLKNFTHDIKGMQNAVTEKTKMIWVCNPNNPTGTMVPTSEIIDLLENVSEDIIVVLDEAYREYVTRDDYMLDSERLLDKYPNLVILRTFSKAYGIAALRVGYTLAHEDIISNINKVRGPFNVNSLAQVAALAALEDQDFIKESFNVNKSGKEYLYKEFDSMGLEYALSETNHIYVNVNKDAFEVFDKLQREGVIIRPIKDTFIRVSIGTMEENKIFIEKLRKVLNI